MHKVFISHHHANDQAYKNDLLALNSQYPIFIDASVDTGDISDDLSDSVIREKIRDEYLRDSKVTLVLVGAETKRRKHVDWEIYSSMFDGQVNKKSGVVVINLPTAYSAYYDAAHTGEKETVYPETTDWTTIDKRSEYEQRYPRMPERIIDNLLKPGAKVSVTPWSKIERNAVVLQFLIDAAYNDRQSCEYDLSRPMRRSNS